MFKELEVKKRLRGGVHCLECRGVRMYKWQRKPESIESVGNERYDVMITEGMTSSGKDSMFAQYEL